MFSSGHFAARRAQARPMRSECHEYTAAPFVEQRVRVWLTIVVCEERRCLARFAATRVVDVVTHERRLSVSDLLAAVGQDGRDGGVLDARE
eukprot:5395227-Pleurochrysis_carterae.AAC.1